MNQPPSDAASLPTGKVIVLTGPPGAGKSTVARLPADRLSPSVHLHSDDFWHFIRQGWIAPYLPEAHRQNEIVIDVLAHATFGYAAGGYQVVCEGIVGPWFIDVFRTAGEARGIPLHYVILRPDQPTTLHRATSRRHQALADPEPVRSLYLQFTGLGTFEGNALDSTHLSPQTTADAVLSGLAEGTYLLEPRPHLRHQPDESIHNS
jgi:hypothetical protein